MNGSNAETQTGAMSTDGMERDHELNECEETVQIREGGYTVKRCESCRRELYSIEWVEPEPTTLDRFVSWVRSLLQRGASHV